MNYFSQISKIMKSRMAHILPVIIDPILESCESKITEQEDKQPTDNSDSDEDKSDDESDQCDIDEGDLDEQTAAIHCLGSLALYCSGALQPYLDRVHAQFTKLGEQVPEVHENVRYHICTSYTQIAMGQLYLHQGKQDASEKLQWTPGLPAKEPLPQPVK